MAQRVDWTMSLFLNSEKLQTESYAVPKHAPSISNSKVLGRGIVVGVVGGGVELNGRKVLRKLETKTSPRMASLRKMYQRPADEPAAKGWWWDATPESAGSVSQDDSVR